MGGIKGVFALPGGSFRQLNVVAAAWLRAGGAPLHLPPGLQSLFLHQDFCSG